MNVGWERFSQETRYLLDVVSYAVTRYSSQDVLGVHAAAPELYEDLLNRVGDRLHLAIESTPSSPRTGVIHLLTWERGLSQVRTDTADFVVIAFRNRPSLKTLKYGSRDSIRLSQVMRQLKDAGMDVHAWGIYSPIHLGWYQIAIWADRLQRYDLGFYLRDRGALSPITNTAARRWANFGVVLGVRT